MKKTFFFLFPAFLVLMFSISALATFVRTETKPVTATYKDVTEELVYSVDIVWGDMNFTFEYNAGSWNPNSLTAGTASSTWTYSTPTANLNGNQIQIVNRSNAMVYCTPSFTDTSGHGISGTFTDSSGASIKSFFLNPAVPGSTDQETIDLNLSGSIPENFNGTVGEVVLDFTDTTNE